MTITIDFDGQHQWKSRNNHYSNRPYSYVKIHGPSGGSMDLWAMLDTGADYLCLDNSVARRLHIPTTGATVIWIRNAVGTRVQVPLVKVKITMETYSADVMAVFGAFTALAGRTAIIPAIKFGMDKDGWLYAQA
jgi:predicted aspartyl protease